VHHADGFKFLEDRKNTFDVIIVDSSDPIGPAQSLFQKPFYTLLSEALRAGGVVCTQGECVWLHMNLIKEMMTFCRTIFPSVDYAYTTIPTYPSGQIGFVLCGKGHTNFRANRVVPRDIQDAMRYYSGDIHRASFILPAFARRELGERF
jgi:spermidine synthase